MKIENEIKIILKKKNQEDEVFYNPDHAVERSLTQLVLLECLGSSVSHPITYADVFCASGIRGIIAMKTVNAQVTFVDDDPQAIALSRRNAAAWVRGPKPMFACSKALDFLRQHPGNFDFVDLDPFGGAFGDGELLPAALKAIRPSGGFLGLSVFDTANLSGAHRYANGAVPVHRSPAAKEARLRLIMADLHGLAQSVQLSLIPIVCLSTDHSARFIVQLVPAAVLVASHPPSFFVGECSDCGLLLDASLLREKRCFHHTSSPVRNCGPLFSGPLYSRPLVARLTLRLDSLKTRDRCWRWLRHLLDSILSEGCSSVWPLSYTLQELGARNCAKTHRLVLDSLKSARLENTSGPSAWCPLAIKSDLSFRRLESFVRNLDFHGPSDPLSLNKGVVPEEDVYYEKPSNVSWPSVTDYQEWATGCCQFVYFQKDRERPPNTSPSRTTSTLIVLLQSGSKRSLSSLVHLFQNQPSRLVFVGLTEPEHRFHQTPEKAWKSVLNRIKLRSKAIEKGATVRMCPSTVELKIDPLCEPLLAASIHFFGINVTDCVSFGGDFAATKNLAFFGCDFPSGIRVAADLRVDFDGCSFGAEQKCSFGGRCVSALSYCSFLATIDCYGSSIVSCSHINAQVGRRSSFLSRDSACLKICDSRVKIGGDGSWFGLESTDGAQVWIENSKMECQRPCRGVLHASGASTVSFNSSVTGEPRFMVSRDRSLIAVIKGKTAGQYVTKQFDSSIIMMM